MFYLHVVHTMPTVNSATKHIMFKWYMKYALSEGYHPRWGRLDLELTRNWPHELYEKEGN